MGACQHGGQAPPSAVMNTLMTFELARLAGTGIALVVMGLAMTSLTLGHARRQADRSALKRLGAFIGDAQEHASARRGWISWSSWDSPGSLRSLENVEVNQVA